MGGWLIGLFLGYSIAHGSIMGFIFWIVVTVIYLIWRICK